jgi:hypothetical protein
MTLLLALLLTTAPDVPKDAPGTWADPARGIFLVPGSRTLLSGFSPVSFDGLPFDDTSYWFDGVKVELPAHALFGPTTLHPGWLEGIHVDAAVDSVERGRSLGRAVELLPRSVKSPGAHGVARVDILQVGLYGEGQVGPLGTTVQAAARFFALPALVASFLKIRALLGDWQLRLAQPVGDGELRFLLLGAFDNAALTVSGIPIEARIQSHQADLRWTSDAARTFELGASAHAKSVGLSLNGEHTQNALDGLEQAVALRAVARPRLTEQAGLSLGADISLRRLVLRRSVTTTVPASGDLLAAPVTSGNQQDFGPAVLAGAHAELTIDEGAWRWRLGLRADLWSPVGASPFVTLDPRLSVRRDAGGPVAFEVALGLKHQPASWLVPIPVLDTAAWRFGMQEAFFGEGALTVRPAEGHALKLRGYGAALLHTLELAPFDADFLQEVTFVSEEVEKRKGSGWVAGGELSWRFFDNGWLWGQAAYSLSGSWRTLNTVRFGDDGLPVGEVMAAAPWQYQQLHAWTAAGGLRTRNGWSLGVALSLQSGPPLMGGLFAQEQEPGVDPITGNPKWVPKDRDQVGNAPPWFRFDARVSKTWRPGNAEIELFLDVQTLSVWAQPTGQSYGVAQASLEDQARGNVQLTTKPSSSVLPGPLPILGVEARL